MTSKLFTILLFLACTFSLIAQSNLLTAKEVLTKSIEYHDPKGKWENGKFDLKLKESRPNGAFRETELLINNKQQIFELSQKRDNRLISRHVKGEQCENRLDGSSTFSKEEGEKFRLDCAYSTRMKDYYVYLYGLPMKLKDPGTILKEEVTPKDFQGTKLLEIKVTYDPEVGADTWYFYFDPSTYALSGYRFYHDESKNDGEYILLTGEEPIGSLRLPKTRAWYTHKEDKLLGTDELVKK